MHHPEAFAGHMVYQQKHTGVFASRMYAFDGKTARLAYTNPEGEAASEMYDFAIDGDTLYALLTDGRILHTKDLNTWKVLDAAPAGSRSLGVLQDRLYVGTADSRLLCYGLPLR
jgi:hypothetical protein